MGSRPSSPHVTNMEDHPFSNPSLPLEEDVRVSQPLSHPYFPHISTISTSYSNPTMSSLANPYHMVYDYDVAYDDPPSSNIPYSFIDSPPCEQPDFPFTILQQMKSHKYTLSFPSMITSLPPVYG